MDVQGKLLTAKIIRGWIVTLMEPERSYRLQELSDLVTVAHCEAGGLLSTLSEEIVTKQFRAALRHLNDEGWVKNSPAVGRDGIEGEIVEIEESWTKAIPLEKDEPLPTLPEKKALKEGEAEVSLGDGPECVYGWYLPAYRELASLKGERRFAMKVGTTINSPSERMRYIGTSPEKPVLGFVWKIKHAHLLERVRNFR